MASSTSGRPQHTIGRVVGYHGCDLSIAKRLLNNEIEIDIHGNDYDWLGEGAYFWVDSARRGIEWAKWKAERGEIKSPCVVGAFINLGLCLSLTDYGVMDDVRNAYGALVKLMSTSGKSLPKNALKRKGVYLKRHLDCAVINMLHFLRIEEGKPEYDSVLGIFEEGTQAFPGACFRQQTHMQIAASISGSMLPAADAHANCSPKSQVHHRLFPSPRL